MFLLFFLNPEKPAGRIAGKNHFVGKYPEVVFLFAISFYNFTELFECVPVFLKIREYTVKNKLNIVSSNVR